MPWNWAGATLLLVFVPLGWVVYAPPPPARPHKIFDQVAALALANTATTMLFMVLAEITHFSGLFDLALASALLALVTGLAFVHVVERWL